MSELLRYESRRRLRGSIALSIAMSALAALVIWVFPSFRAAFEGDDFLDAYPDQLLRLFDIRAMTTIEGFLATELYVFGWIILLGLYAGYLAAGRIASDIEHGRVDILLALPLSRGRVTIELFASLAVPIVLVNIIPFGVVFVGTALVGYPVALEGLLTVHLLSVPYLFACAAIGLLASVSFDRGDIAQRVALGAIFGLYLVESLVVGTEYEAVGLIAPSRHYDPSAILVDGTDDFVETLVLVAFVAVLLLVSIVRFRHRDV
jgi:ABC-2 type transport system permease protein